MTPTYKHIKVTGQSSESIEGAIRAALATTGKTVSGHSWFQVVEIRGNLGSGADIEDYQVTLEVGFAVVEPKGSGTGTGAA